MVIGNGMVATAFESYRTNEGFLIFASGVSDSTATDKSLFEREKKLLVKSIAENPEKQLVYISTCSMYDTSMQNSPYVIHKLGMENIIKESATTFSIFRMPNLAGKTTNPHTVINYFYFHIINNSPFQLWENASRNIIDVSDAFAICNMLLRSGQASGKTINVANPSNYTVLEIVQTIENVIGIKGNYVLVKKGGSPVIDTTLISGVINSLAINFDNNYLKSLIEKYLLAHDV